MLPENKSFWRRHKADKSKTHTTVIELRILSHKCKREWGKGMSMLRGNPIMADLAGRSLPSSNFNTWPHNWNLSYRSHRVCTEAGEGLQSGNLLDLGMTRQVQQAYIWYKKEIEWSLSYSTSTVSIDGVLREYARLKKLYTATVEVACGKTLK